MIKQTLFLLLAFWCITPTLSQNNANAFYVGHSLSDQIPDMVKSLAADHQEVTFDWVYQSIPGAPLRWQWDRKNANDYYDNPPHYYGFYNEDGGLPTGSFDVLVLTEAVPRYGELIEETYEYADSFFVYANAYNPDIQVYLYEDWHCILSGTPTECDYDVDSNPWRQRIKDDLPMWESVVDTLNQRFNPEKPVCLIPAAQGLAQVYDSIYTGVMPGLTTIEDLFLDNIHLTDVGKYFVACVHFATIFEISPIGLTNQLQLWWGGDFEAPSPELALKFQEIAWEVSTTYDKSCVASSVNTNEVNSLDVEVKVYPNPVKDVLYVNNGVKSLNYFIYNIYGELVLTSNKNEINVLSLSSGVYWLYNGESVIKFIKG